MAKVGPDGGVHARVAHHVGDEEIEQVDVRCQLPLHLIHLDVPGRSDVAAFFRNIFYLRDFRDDGCGPGPGCLLGSDLGDRVRHHYLLRNETSSRGHELFVEHHLPGEEHFVESTFALGNLHSSFIQDLLVGFDSRSAKHIKVDLGFLRLGDGVIDRLGDGVDTGTRSIAAFDGLVRGGSGLSAVRVALVARWADVPDVGV